MKLLMIILISMFFVHTSLFSQNAIENVLAEIEKNNTALSALRKKADADRIQNNTGRFLSNPEFEYHYLWGNPSALGNRKDLSISQSFDFPTTYKYRNDISEIKNEQVELDYEQQKKDLQLNSRIICNELIFMNSMISELQKRKTLADSVFIAFRKKFDVGETNILEYNKARLNLLSAEKALKTYEIKRSSLLLELQGLNGGIPIAFETNNFPVLNVPEDFEAWYQVAEQKNPILTWLKKEIEINRNREKLSKAMQLPKLHTGYMSEKRPGVHFQGVTFGISIPLWENINIVKHAVARTEAIKCVIADNKQQFYNQLRILHLKFIQLQKNVIEYKYGMQNSDNTEMLKKALKEGEISLIDYILELTIYYDSIDKILEMEKELNNSFAELNQYI